MLIYTALYNKETFIMCHLYMVYRLDCSCVKFTCEYSNEISAALQYGILKVYILSDVGDLQ